MAACAILLAACGGESAPPAGVPYSESPAGAAIELADLRRFWAAYDAGGRDGDISAYQRRYLDSASAGLRALMQSRQVTAASLAAMTRIAPAYFDALRGQLLPLTADAPVFATIRANYERVEQRYPESVFPALWMLVGRFSTGGTTAGGAGMLIGSEFFGADAAPPLDGLPAFARANVRSLATLPPLVAHEHAHILQARAGARGLSDGHTLLERTLAEGGAEFLAELVSGANTMPAQHAWARPRERAVWEEFQREMRGTDITRWLYNQGTATADRPGDLGYFVGYRIAQAYYRRAADTTQAFRDLVALRDAEGILRASGYDGSGP
ncbi:MAG: DUF2268 domain-containing putative Zn-dependent protease [Gemmatimonadales bacterium]|nr:DUF2268 domain-containing putative Zn-dependent protease [Gemmatimonadales bacterium]